MMKPVNRPRRRYALCVASIATGGLLLLSGGSIGCCSSSRPRAASWTDRQLRHVEHAGSENRFLREPGPELGVSRRRPVCATVVPPISMQTPSGMGRFGRGSRRVLLTNCNALATQKKYTCILDPVQGCVCNPQDPVWPPAYVNCGVNWPYYVACSG